MERKRSEILKLFVVSDVGRLITSSLNPLHLCSILVLSFNFGFASSQIGSRVCFSLDKSFDSGEICVGP
jgi:hypothetical protein